MTKFADIAIALSGARGSGKTVRMLKSAPPNSVVLGANENHIVSLKAAALALGRQDLKFASMSKNLRGLDCCVSLDHFTVERLLFEANQEIMSRDKKIADLAEKCDRLQYIIDAELMGGGS